jgi:hypothetical protein
MMHGVKKTSPNRENLSDIMNNGPSSARNNARSKLVFARNTNTIMVSGGSRFQPNQQSASIKRSKKKISSTSCKKRSPQAKKVRGLPTKL